MIDQEYVSALVDFGNSSATNLAALQNRSCTLFEQIGLYGGAQLVSIAAPGQHIGLSRPTTLQDEFGAVRQALKIIAGQPLIIRTTSPVFW